MNSQETALAETSALGLTVTPQPTVYEWNRADLLPPVGCPLVIKIDGAVVHAERTNHLTDKSGQMTYMLSGGQLITGRFQWSYP